MKMKKLLAMVLCVAMVLSMMAFTVSAESTAYVWDGTSYSLDWLSTGNPEANAGDKFYLNSAEDLAGLAYYVNTYASTNNIFAGDTIYLNVDVDLNNHDWDPIGTGLPREKNRFYGSFDGQGHTISNLKVASGHYFAGLFGQIPTYTYTQTFSNVTIDNANVVSADEAKSKEAAGALIGRANGTVIDNCHVTGEINISGDRFVGGLLGHSYAQISDCSVEATGTINANTWQAGGLVGSHGATDTYISSVKDCSVIGKGDNGLNITSYFASAGGAIGDVSLIDVDSTPVDGITVANVSIEAVSTASGSGIAYVASGYTATNSTISNVSATLGDEECVATDADSVAAAVALVGNSGYATLQEAIDAAKVNGDTVTLTTDLTIEAGNGGYSKAGIVQNGFDIDGNGHTLNVTGANTTWDCAIYTNGGTIKNLTIASGMRGVFTAGQTEDIILENVTIDGPIYTISADGASGVKWIIKNSTLNGWTSYASGFEVVSFENCTFGEGSGYAYMRPYADTIYTGCDFTDDYSVDARADIEMTDCSIDGTPMTAEDVAELLGGSAQANIGSVYYDSINDAFAAAVDGDTITIFAGEYEGFDVPANKNNLTFVGETDADGNNLVTIKTLEDGITSHNGGIFVGSETTTFKNLNFTAGTTAGVGSSWMSSSLGNTNGDTGMSSSLKNLTVENCNFTGSGAYQAIWTNQGNVTVKNTTIKNYANGIDNYGIGADQKVVIENSKITDVHNAFHTGEAADGAKIVVTETDIDSEVINVGGSVAVTVEESTIKNAAVTTYASSTFAVSESALYDTTYAVDANATGSITLDAVYVNNVNELAANAKADNIAFNTYYPEAKDLGTGNTVAVPAATDAIYVKFENVTDADAEGEMTYNINLVATDTEIINRLNSADLTFAFDATEGDVAYEIIASNSEVAVNPVDNSKVRYEFHYNGKDGVTTDSANKITIGQVRFEGYGKFDFTVDAAVDTNTAHATTVADNIVDTFIPNGDAATVANGELVIDDTTITDVVIAVPDRNLTISIDFPNAVEDQVIAYQDMKVVISGGDLAKDITIDLGNDAVETALDIFGKEDAKFAAAMDNNGSYVINVTDALTLNNAYTVTVSGAGYRTARYTVTMTEDKALRFWNNVMDEKQFVEIGKESSKVNVTFLAGDIVKDNKINIYDLSAVVSYFGTTTDRAAKDDYVKYDLNRDGVIDSKDVAYVLVSWNN